MNVFANKQIGDKSFNTDQHFINNTCIAYNVKSITAQWLQRFIEVIARHRIFIILTHYFIKLLYVKNWCLLKLSPWYYLLNHGIHSDKQRWSLSLVYDYFVTCSLIGQCKRFEYKSLKLACLKIFYFLTVCYTWMGWSCFNIINAKVLI